MAKKRPAPKKTRNNRSDEEKTEIVRKAILAIRADPNFELVKYAYGIGVYEGILRVWLNRYGKRWGWRGSLRNFDRDTPVPAGLELPGDAPAPAAAEETPALIPPASAWAEKFGGELREAMGVESQGEPPSASEEEPEASQTLISSGTPSRRKLGRPSNAERKARAEAAGIERYGAPRDFSPRRVEMYPPDDARQPELPFRAEPVQPEHQPARATANEFTLKALEQSLKERDAFKTVCEVLMREKSGTR